MYFKANPRSCAISPLHILVNISESRAILCHCSSIIKLLEVTGLLAVTCTWYRRGLLAASRSFMDPVVFIHVQPETHHSFDCVWLMSFLVKKVSILPLPPYCFPPSHWLGEETGSVFMQNVPLVHLSVSFLKVQSHPLLGSSYFLKTGQ